MIADVNVTLALAEIFCSVKLVSDESELTKDPAPDVKEEVSNASGLLSEEKRKHKTRKEDDHEYGKYKEYPNLVECAEN